MNTVIAILGGGLKKEKNGIWRSTNFDEGDNFGADGSRVRIIAGAYLYKNNLCDFIVASGGKGQYKKNPEAPNISSVIKRELIELGIPSKKIIEEKKSNNTYEQLREFKKIIENKKIKKFKIISNKYHLPRIKAMIEIDNKLNGLFKKKIIKLESAEKIILKYDSKKWLSIINDAYSNRRMKEKIKLENQGLKDIKNGTYKFK